MIIIGIACLRGTDDTLVKLGSAAIASIAGIIVAVLLLFHC